MSWLKGIDWSELIELNWLNCIDVLTFIQRAQTLKNREYKPFLLLLLLLGVPVHFETSMTLIWFMWTCNHAYYFEFHIISTRSDGHKFRLENVQRWRVSNASKRLIHWSNIQFDRFHGCRMCIGWVWSRGRRWHTGSIKRKDSWIETQRADRHCLGEWTQKSKFDASKGTRARVVVHTGTQVTGTVKMWLKMRPHSKVLICTLSLNGLKMQNSMRPKAHTPILSLTY